MNLLLDRSLLDQAAVQNIFNGDPATKIEGSISSNNDVEEAIPQITVDVDSKDADSPTQMHRMRSDFVF